jgi:hypothetical protein
MNNGWEVSGVCEPSNLRGFTTYSHKQKSWLRGPFLERHQVWMTVLWAFCYLDAFRSSGLVLLKWWSCGFFTGSGRCVHVHQLRHLEDGGSALLRNVINVFYYKVQHTEDHGLKSAIYQRFSKSGVGLFRRRTVCTCYSVSNIMTACRKYSVTVSLKTAFRTLWRNDWIFYPDLLYLCLCDGPMLIRKEVVRGYNIVKCFVFSVCWNLDNVWNWLGNG